MIKLIAIDLDGTLFDKEKNISDENIKAIKKAKEKNIKVVIATGRPISGVLPVLEKLNLTTNEDYVITYNGAKVFNVGTKEVISSSTILGSDVKSLYNESLRLGVNFHAFRETDELITPKHNPYTDVESKINKVPDLLFDFNKIKDEDKFIKAMMVDSDENITKIMPLVDSNFTTSFSMVRSSKIFLEFLNKKTHKGFAVIALANYLNISLDEVMAIGDAGNDIPMIEIAGVGVAMENAFKEVKEKAKFITLDNEHSGVSYAINKYALEII